MEKDLRTSGRETGPSTTEGFRRIGDNTLLENLAGPPSRSDTSLPVSQNTGTALTQSSPSRKTGVQHGRDGAGGPIAAANTGQPALGQDEVKDILSLLSRIKPYSIEPTDQKAVTTALNALEYCLIPATYDEAVAWIIRMLAHFPRRDVDKDAVIASDLAGAAINEGATLMAIAYVCESAWRSSNRKRPWPPESGQFLDDVSDKTKSFKFQYDRLKNPKPALSAPKKEPKPERFEGRKWPDLTEDERKTIAKEAQDWDRNLQQIWSRLWQVPDFEQFINYFEKNDPNPL